MLTFKLLLDLPRCTFDFSTELWYSSRFGNESMTVCGKDNLFWRSTAVHDLIARDEVEIWRVRGDSFIQVLDLRRGNGLIEPVVQNEVQMI